ncbi:MAG: DUF5719 family protein [Aquihabitans sp.]
MARRKAGRHASTARGITPRRWLPFAALVAVIATSVVITREVNPPTERTATVAAPESLMPVAAVPRPISSTWFCAGGTAVGPQLGADLSVVIANADDHGVEALVSVFGPGAKRKAEPVKVPANGRVRVAVRDILPGDWAAATVEVFGGRATVERRVEGADGFEVAPCSSTASSHWYVPSGSTVRGATLRLVLFNPFPDATSVDIRFDTDNGSLSPRPLQGVSVPGRSLRVVTVQNPARRRQVAATISTRTGRIVVDRLQSYDGTGDPVAGAGPTPLDTEAPRGLASTPAIPAASARWFFPDARLVTGGRTQVAIHNPGSRSADLDVVLSFEDPDRYPDVEPIQVKLRSGEETVIDLTDRADISPGIPFTVDVRSLEGAPVVAELLWFTGSAESQGTGEAPPPDQGSASQDGATEADGADPATDPGVASDGTGPVEDPPEATIVFAPGFSVTAGSPLAARSWFVAGRGADVDLESSVVVANVSAAPVRVFVAELVGGNRRPLGGSTVTIPAHDRRVLDLAGAEPWSGLVVSGDGPLVVGRSIWSTDGRGISTGIATPFPDKVVRLPAVR